MDGRLDRRTFLRRGGAATLGLAAFGTGAPAALSSWVGRAAAAPRAASLGTMSLQLSWIKNAEFAGEYIADTRGYYKKVGFSAVDLLSGGPSVAQDAVVAAGKALVGVSSPDITGPAIAQGAPIIAVAAQYQKNPFAIMSLAKSPIRNPKEMIGKKIGIQSTNQAVWNSFLKANGIPASKITEVPVQFDPSPLAAGQVDGWFSFITNEPIELAAKGYKTVTFLLNDFHYPLVSEIYVVRKDTLSSAANRNKIKALLVAEIMGWHDSLRDPALGAKLAVNKYGANQGLNVAEQTKESIAQNKLILTPRTKKDGILTVTPAQVEENVHTLSLGGTKLKASQLFDLSLIDEVYQEHPGLKASPV